MKFLKTVLNRPKFQLFPVKFPVNREFPPVTGSLKTASTTTQSFEFIGKGIESERPKLSSGFRAMMQSFLSKTPNSMHYSARSPQKFLLRLLKWDLEAGYWCTILFRFEHSPPLSLQKTANERGGKCRLIKGLLDYGVPEINGHRHHGLAVVTACCDAELPLLVRTHRSLKCPRLL